MAASWFLGLQRFLLMLVLVACALSRSSATPDQSITKSVWKMIYGVTDAQINEQPPYVGWMSQDADGDGVSNGDELIAGTNPFVAGSVLAVASETLDPDNVHINLAFPTLIGKRYDVQQTSDLAVPSWGPVSPAVSFTGTTNSLVTVQVPRSGTQMFFHVLVQDFDSQTDGVGNWAKHLLGYLSTASLGSQSSYSSSSLGTTLQGVNVVTLNAVGAATTQPAAGNAAADVGLVTISRSGYLLLNSITVPLTKSGDAVAGTDYENNVPSVVTFPAGVKSLDVKITPKYNSARTTSATVVLTAGAPGVGSAAGNYTLGTPSTASVTIYPSGDTTGTGLTGTYFSGSNSTYSNNTNLGQVPATYTYSASGGVGTANVTYQATVTITAANPAVVTWTAHSLTANTPIVFSTSGSLPAPLVAGTTYYVTSTSILTNSFRISATPGGADISTLGGGGSGTHKGSFLPPAVPFAIGLQVYLTFTSGPLLTNDLVLYAASGIPPTANRWDRTYTVTNFDSATKTLTVSVTGTTVPATGTGSGACTLGPYNAPIVTHLDPTVDFTWNTGLPTNSTLPTSTNDNWSGRFDGWLNPPTTGNYDLQIQADDGARVYVDNTLVIDAWTPGSSTFTAVASADFALTAGVRAHIRLEYLELNNTASVTLQWKKPGDSSFSNIPSGNVFLDAATSTNGWTGLYWSNTSFAGLPRFAEYPASINLNWTTSVPSQTLPSADNFSIRWEGFYQPSSTGSYVFDIQASDGARVYLDVGQDGTFDPGDKIIDAWTPADSAAVTPAQSGTVSLTAGQKYKMRVEYYEGTGNALVKLRAKVGAGSFAAVNASTNVFRPDPVTGLATATAGWWSSYYSNAALTDPPLYSIQETSASSITNDYTSSKPANSNLGTGGSANDNWASSFETYIKAPSAGNYTFQTVAASGGNDFVRLRIDTGSGLTELIPFTTGTSAASSPIALTANQTYHVVVEHYNLSGNALVGINWTTPTNGSLVAVPAAQLYRDSGATIAGVVASYYPNTALYGSPSLVQYPTQIILASTGGVPSQTITADNFSATWEGYLQASQTGFHKFDIQADDGARVYLDLDQNGSFGGGETIIDAWAAGSSTSTPMVSADCNLTAGQRYKMRVEFYDATGFASCKLRWIQPSAVSMAGIPNTNFYRDNTTPQTGVLATYYPNSTLTLPTTAPFAYSVAENNNPEVTFDFGSGRPFFTNPVTITIASPAVVSWPNHGLTLGTPVIFTTTGALPTGLTAGASYFVISNGFTADSFQVSATSGGSAVNTSGTQSGVQSATATLIGVDQFSVRWTGQILPQYTDTYFFDARSDEGTKLWINNQLVINKWQTQTVTDQLGRIDLVAGIPYDIRLEYFENTGTAEAHLNWYSYDQAKQIIPTPRLFPTQTGATPRAGDALAGGPAITSPTTAVALIGSGSPFSLTLTASNGGSNFTATGLPSWLALANGVLSGTPGAGDAGTYQFTVTVTNAAGSASSVITVRVISTGSQLTRDLWTSGVTGPNLADVLWTTAPSSSDTVSLAEDPTTSYAANTGERLRGYLTVPISGNYYFWISGSNVAELWLSNDAEPVSKIRRCYVTGPTGTLSRTWYTQIDTTPTALWPNGTGANKQQSGWLALTAGQKYYIEVLHNTGASGAGNNLSVGWFLDPTGNTATPIANGSGVIPGYVLSSWDNPTTITTPGTIYLANLQGAAGLSAITGTGGAYVTINGQSAIVHLIYSGLTSGATYRRIYAAPVGNNPPQLLFDIDAQDRNYPALKTSDAGYTWNMSASDLTALSSGMAFISIGTVNNPGGELTGTFGFTSGSQTAPAAPSYPSYTDDHGTLAGASRFLSQATFGPSPADITSVKNIGFRNWIDAQFSAPTTHLLPYVLNNLSTDPTQPYPSTTTFNSWWRNSVTAPDQLRQRVAFALSEILVVSDTGPLNVNGRILADFYDTLTDYAFDSFRNILKQVTLSPAMGIYLDMRGNVLGNNSTGVHPNENYAREIMQLFSINLYRRWPDGSLALDSNGLPVPTYDQSVITGLSRVFTGWNYGQPLVSGRLPTSGPSGVFNPNYLDAMVLVSPSHELGTKILLDNVMLPPATVITQDLSTSSFPIKVVVPTAAPGDSDSINPPTISTNYDLNGLRDLEATIDNIHNNLSVAPYICRQLIQRLVTSSPTPAYVHRVVRAFKGERNVDNIATGVRGDMKDVIRAILLDPEARESSAALANTQFGKEREPLLRLTGPARSFLPSAIPNSNYRQNGVQAILITTPTPHRLTNDNVLIDTFVDGGADATKLPSAQSYSAGNTTPAYTHTRSTAQPYTSTGNTVTITTTNQTAGTALYVQFTSGTLSGGTFDGVYTITSATAANYTITLGSSPANTSGGCTTVLTTITAPAYQTGDTVMIQFTGGNLNVAPFSTVQTYTVRSANATSCAIYLGDVNASGLAIATTSGSTLTPNNFTVNAGSLSSTSYAGTTVTISNASPAVVTWTAHGLAVDSPVIFATTGTLPTGLTAGTTYYVRPNSTNTANTFQVSLTSGGTSINTSSNGSGTHTAIGSSKLIVVSLGTSSGYIANNKVNLNFVTGALRGAGYDNTYTINSSPAPAASTFTVTLPSMPANATAGTVLIPRVAGGYVVTTSGSTSTITVSTLGNHNLKVGDHVQIDVATTFPQGIPSLPLLDGEYIVTNVAFSANSSTNPYQFQFTTTPAISATSQSSGLTIWPLTLPPYTNRSGTCTVQLHTWGIGNTNGNVTQTPLNAPTVFNFFYPDYRFPGAIALAGMTTPEFQLTNDTNIINLTNTLNTGLLNQGNPNGYTSFPAAGGQIYMDMSTYMTEPQTNGGLSTLIDTLGDLLTGGALQPGTKSTISAYVTNNIPLSTPPTNTQMRDRVRAIAHLIIVSPEYAIQK